MISHFWWSKYSLFLFRHHLSKALLELNRLWEATSCCLWLDETFWHVILGCVNRWVQCVIVWQRSWMLRHQNWRSWDDKWWCCLNRGEHNRYWIMPDESAVVKLVVLVLFLDLWCYITCLIPEVVFDLLLLWFGDFRRIKWLKVLPVCIWVHVLDKFWEVHNPIALELLCEITLLLKFCSSI